MILEYGCKDWIWDGPKLGLDFSPISLNNEFIVWVKELFLFQKKVHNDCSIESIKHK